ncbi:uncharacterized protein LOC117324838 [Pecten maximus]|uniref:uncharacterized protein LOC117324838 n=1 Tax=Pecten maximus TaxID=6579 RepID=UPI0014588814|nr:uncharacterized protein LOC117324838 [Pecten maximus]
MFQEFFLHLENLADVHGADAREVLKSSELSPEQLVDVWDLSDLNKDGCLDTGEWTLACQLVRLHKQGYKLEGSINGFTYLPDRISLNSLQARKQRVNEYDSYKQRLMSIKEKRKAQAVQESRRLSLMKDKVSLEKDLYAALTRLGRSPVSEDRHSRLTATDSQEIEKLKEIIARLKKEHEKIRHDTVKVILGEQKLHGENAIIKEETTELNKVRTVVIPSLELLNKVRTIVIPSLELLSKVRTIAIPSLELHNKVRTIVIPSLQLLNKVRTIVIPSLQLLNKVRTIVIPSLQLLSKVRTIVIPSLELHNKVRTIVIPSLELLSKVRTIVIPSLQLLNKVRTIVIPSLQLLIK